jgi:hypothetical protein
VEADVTQSLLDVIRLLARRKGGFRASDPLLEPFGPPAVIDRDVTRLVETGEVIAVRMTAKSVVYFGSRTDAYAWILRDNRATWDARQGQRSRVESQVYHGTPGGTQ